MPHANEPERFERITNQMQSVKLVPLSEFQGGEAKPVDKANFPKVGETDANVFEDNLLEVMQFVFNHTTFDPSDELDQQLLAAYEPLGIAPGKTYDASQVAKIDSKRVRQVAERIFSEEMAKTHNPEFKEKALTGLLQPKGEIGLDLLLYQSILGPIGQPAAEAVYPAIATTDGNPMNASNDYVIEMTADELPPAKAFWSFTLYDTKNGFFMPNERKKYSVGENGGMKLNEDGGITIYLAANKPEGVPEENWLPVTPGNYDMDVILRIYVPDMEKFKTWQAPKAEMLSATESTTVDQAKKAAKDAFDKAKEAAKSAYEKAKEAAKEAYEKVKEAVGSTETKK